MGDVIASVIAASYAVGISSPLLEVEQI